MRPMLFHDLAIFETKLKERGTQFLIYIYIYICHESLCGGTEISNYYILVNTSHIVLHKFCVLSIYLFFSHLLCIVLSWNFLKFLSVRDIKFCWPAYAAIRTQVKFLRMSRYCDNDQDCKSYLFPLITSSCNVLM